MKTQLRNRFKLYGNPGLLFPYLTVLWFFPEHGETRIMAQELAHKFRNHLSEDKGWRRTAFSQNAYSDKAAGIIFLTKESAQKALALYHLWTNQQ